MKLLVTKITLLFLSAELSMIDERMVRNDSAANDCGEENATNRDGNSRFPRAEVTVAVSVVLKCGTAPSGSNCVNVARSSEVRSVSFSVSSHRAKKKARMIPAKPPVSMILRLFGSTGLSGITA